MRTRAGGLGPPDGGCGAAPPDTCTPVTQQAQPELQLTPTTTKGTTVTTITPTVYLTDTQVSVRTGLARQTLANWRVTGYGPPFVRWGRVVRYPEAALVAWAEQTHP